MNLTNLIWNNFYIKIMYFKMQTFTLNNKLIVNYLLMSSILQALVASSYVPVFSGMFPAVFRGKVRNSNIHLLLMQGDIGGF